MTIMPINLQISSINKWLVKHGIDPDTVDIRSLIDSTLHYYENLKVISEHVGLPTVIDEFVAKLDKYESMAEEYEQTESPEFLRKKIGELESALDLLASKSPKKELEVPAEPPEKIRVGFKKKFEIPSDRPLSFGLEARVDKHLENIKKRVSINDDKIESLDDRLKSVEFTVDESRRDLLTFQTTTGASLDEIVRIITKMPEELMKEAERKVVRELPTPTVLKRVDPKTGEPFWGPDDYAIRTLMTLFPFPGDYYYASPLRQRFGFGQKPLADLISEELSRPAYLRRVPMPSTQVSKRGLASGMSMEEIDHWLGMLLSELREKEEKVEDVEHKMYSIALQFLELPEDILSYGLEVLIPNVAMDLEKEYGFIPDAHSLAVLIGGVGRKFTDVPRTLKYVPEEAASWLWEKEYETLLALGMDIAYEAEAESLRRLWSASGEPTPSYEELYDFYKFLLTKIRNDIRERLVAQV